MMFNFTDDRLIHATKTAFAVLVGFAITRSVHFPIDQWLIITILVVMCAQISVGSMLQKSYMRFLGTLSGSLIAALTLILFGANILASICTVSIAALLFSYLATSDKSYHEAGTLGAVTVAIILLGQNPTAITATERFLEISLGILIAALISQFILPIHARVHLRNNQAQTLRQLRAYYLATLLADQDNEIKTSFQIIDETVIKTLITQRKLATDAIREPLGKSYNLANFKQSLWCEKEILRSITFMFHAYNADPATKKALSSLPEFQQFNDQACSALDALASNLDKPLRPSITLPTIQPLKQKIIVLNADADTEGKIHLYGFLFAAETLVARLEQLLNLVEAAQAQGEG